MSFDGARDDLRVIPCSGHEWYIVEMPVVVPGRWACERRGPRTWSEPVQGPPETMMVTVGSGKRPG